MEPLRVVVVMRGKYAFFGEFDYATVPVHISYGEYDYAMVREDHVKLAQWINEKSPGIARFELIPNMHHTIF